MNAPPRYAPVPPPQRPGGNGLLKALAAVTLVAVTVMAVVVTVLALRLVDTQRDVDRAAGRFERSSRDLKPAIDDLRDAAQSLRDSRPAAP